MLPGHLLFLDLETTGATPLHDRIIEIGLCEVIDGKLICEWSTLVNPEKTISPFIEQFTGISNAMVAGQPTFGQISDELIERLSGKVLVAHNARFDYGFLKSEFRRLQIDFQEKVLCTVKLSRALYPEHRRHNLDALVDRHGLSAQHRHRALGDARLVWEFFQKIHAELSPECIGLAVKSQLKQPTLPPYLAKEQVAALPNTPGVYLLYGENDSLLYIGKSVDIRSRVLSHFAGDHRVHKGMRLSQQVRHIDWIETAGELGALLLEARLIKERVPIHNRSLRRTRDLSSLQLVMGKQGHAVPEIVSLKGVRGEELGNLFGTFRSRSEAEKTLREIIREHALCTKVLGLEKAGGACFNYQIKKCRGACVGEEPLPQHQARLTLALSSLKVRSWPFRGPVGIRESSSCADRVDIHVFDHWCHLGTARGENELWEILADATPLPFDVDSYKILVRFLQKHPRPDVLNLSRPSRVVHFD
jgi:DNA polymerase III subunit epsilon